MNHNFMFFPNIWGYTKNYCNNVTDGYFTSNIGFFPKNKNVTRNSLVGYKVTEKNGLPSHIRKKSKKGGKNDQ